MNRPQIKHRCKFPQLPPCSQQNSPVFRYEPAFFSSRLVHDPYIFAWASRSETIRHCRASGIRAGDDKTGNPTRLGHVELNTARSPLKPGLALSGLGAFTFTFRSPDPPPPNPHPHPRAPPDLFVNESSPTLFFVFVLNNSSSFSFFLFSF